MLSFFGMTKNDDVSVEHHVRSPDHLWSRFWAPFVRPKDGTIISVFIIKNKWMYAQYEWFSIRIDTRWTVSKVQKEFLSRWDGAEGCDGVLEKELHSHGGVMIHTTNPHYLIIVINFKKEGFIVFSTLCVSNVYFFKQVKYLKQLKCAAWYIWKLCQTQSDLPTQVKGIWWVKTHRGRMFIGVYPVNSECYSKSNVPCFIKPEPDEVGPVELSRQWLKWSWTMETVRCATVHQD